MKNMARIVGLLVFALAAVGMTLPVQAAMSRARIKARIDTECDNGQKCYGSWTVSMGVPTGSWGCHQRPTSRCSTGVACTFWPLNAPQHTNDICICEGSPDADGKCRLHVNWAANPIVPTCGTTTCPDMNTPTCKQVTIVLTNDMCCVCHGGT